MRSKIFYKRFWRKAFSMSKSWQPTTCNLPIVKLGEGELPWSHVSIRHELFLWKELRLDKKTQWSYSTTGSKKSCSHEIVPFPPKKRRSCWWNGRSPWHILISYAFASRWGTAEPQSIAGWTRVEGLQRLLCTREQHHNSCLNFWLIGNCLWPFWDGENATLLNGFWWPPTFGDEKVTAWITWWLVGCWISWWDGLVGWGKICDFRSRLGQKAGDAGMRRWGERTWGFSIFTKSRIVSVGGNHDVIPMLI